MGFSSLLSKIQHKSICPPSSSSSPNPSIRPKPDNSLLRHSRSSGNNTSGGPVSHSTGSLPLKPLDPAVQRLKELRRQEREKKDEQLKSAQSAKREITARLKPQRKSSNYPSSSSSSNKSKSQSQIILNPRYLQEQQQKQMASQPVKRMNFAELMKEAQNKGKAIESVKTDESHTPKAFVSRTQSRSSEILSKRIETTPKYTLPRSSSSPSPSLISNSRVGAIKEKKLTSKPYQKPTPKPLAQPSAKLKARLDARNSGTKKSKEPTYQRSTVKGTQPMGHRHQEYSDDEEEYSDEYDEDDFVVNDEEGQEDDGRYSRNPSKQSRSGPDYDREEIWRIMGRGKSRSSYYDEYEDDLSDMEATGADILEEEQLSMKRARIEDMKEQERERKLAEEKRRRLGR